MKFKILEGEKTLNIYYIFLMFYVFFFKVNFLSNICIGEIVIFIWKKEDVEV